MQQLFFMCDLFERKKKQKKRIKKMRIQNRHTFLRVLRHILIYLNHL